MISPDIEISRLITGPDRKRGFYTALGIVLEDFDRKHPDTQEADVASINIGEEVDYINLEQDELMLRTDSDLGDEAGVLFSAIEDNQRTLAELHKIT